MRKIPKVKNEFETVQKILDDRVSIARFGDGELKLCIGKNQILQNHSGRIERKLRSILRSSNPDLLVGIPRLVGPNKKLWERYLKQPRFAQLYEKGKQYYSAFISRPDSVPQIDCASYWDLVKKIWRDRDVVLLRGRDCPFCSKPDFFDGARSVRTVRGPCRDAFDRFDVMFVTLQAYPDDTLFLLSLGPSATVLAGELAGIGRQAVDIGHMGMFYDRTHPKSGRIHGADK
jgi:hypothetical protein